MAHIEKLTVEVNGHVYKATAMNPNNRGWVVRDAPPELAGRHKDLAHLRHLFEKWAEEAENVRVGSEVLDAVPPPPTRDRPSPPPSRAKLRDKLGLEKCPTCGRLNPKKEA